MALIKRTYTDRETVITAENLNDIQDAVIMLEDGLLTVDDNRSGEVITITDAAKRSFRSFNIYGKTTQNGTPTHEAPAELISAGNSGSVAVNVSGKNLFDVAKMKLGEPSIMSRTATGFVFTRGTFTGGTYASYTMPIAKGETVTFSCKGSEYNPTLIIYKDAIYGTQLISAIDKTALTYTADENILSAVFAVVINSQNGNCAVSDIQIELGTKVTEYEPYKGQKLTLSTPNGLPGIPVTSGGNYTDAEGQQWICDEIDLARGVYMKRCGVIVIDGSGEVRIGQHGNLQRFYAKSIPDIINLDANSPKMVLSDRYEASGWTDKDNRVYCIGNNLVITDNRFTDETVTLAILQEEKPRMVYVLATPVESSLSAEELATYAALHTYKEHTTISNDALAYMDLEYVMDSKTYFESLTSAPPVRMANIVLKASAWVGSGSLYSQVVNVSGITENSQINLTPSVEQLSVFYEKDITFVTENDGGVVTVYVIGQKPQNDYTIQADIVEVTV